MNETQRTNALKERTLFSPKVFKFPDMTGKTVIMTPLEPDFRLYKQAFGPGKSNRLFMAEIVTDIPQYPNAALCGPFLGGPHAAMLLEVLAAKGARRFIFCGLCGALNSGMPGGSVFIAASALSDEGVARHYSAETVFKANDVLAQKLGNSLKRADMPFTVGRMASIDAIFRETPTIIDYYRQQDCQAVDMETAALYAAAGYHNLDICGIFAVSDVFDGAEWRAEFNNTELKPVRMRLAEIVKEMV